MMHRCSICSEEFEDDVLLDIHKELFHNVENSEYTIEEEELNSLQNIENQNEDLNNLQQHQEH